MSPRQDDRTGLVPHVRFAACAAATTWAALLSWRGFTTDSAVYLADLVMVGIVVAATGALARWRRLPGLAVVTLQVVLGVAVTCQVVSDQPLPGPAFWEALSGAVDAANTYAAPVPMNDAVSVRPLLVVGGLIAMLLVDLCAATLRRAPLAGLPLLTVYSVPISLIDRGLSWWVFAATAIGFLLLLFLQEEEHLARWGRMLDGGPGPARRLSDSVRASAIGIGAVATAAAVVVPLAIPTISLSVFDLGPGNGGDGEIEVTNPMVDLRQDLVRDGNVDLLRVRTDDPDPDHLRISVLNRFTDDQWSAGDRSVPTSNLAQGSVPEPEGEPRLVSFTPAEYDVEVTDDFASKWLPTQAPISDINADGDWRYDETTVDFLASDDDLTTAGLEYRMTALLPTYRDERLLDLETSPFDAAPELSQLPDDLPEAIRDLARVTTEDAATDFEAAVMLNQFFRSDGGFTYQLPSGPEDAIGTGELVDFLNPANRTGYCEQFAAAMGVMARTLGIPARVAVGFLQPDRRDGDAYVYTAYDLHAWVELYFPDAGWVLFDPTPPARVGGGLSPDYAEQRIGGSGPAQVPTAEPTEQEPTGPSLAPRGEEPRTPQTPETAPEAADRETSSFPWGTVLVVVGLVVLLVLLALAPRWLRGRQRARRLGAGPESAWEELRATALDLGRGWPESRSPRETRDRVVDWFGRAGNDAQRPAHGPAQAPDAVAALDRIVGHLERHRYARQHAVVPGGLRDDVEVVSASLVAGATPRRRRRAAWLPVSAFQRRTVTDLDRPASGDAEQVGARSEVL